MCMLSLFTPLKFLSEQLQQRDCCPWTWTTLTLRYVQPLPLLGAEYFIVSMASGAVVFYCSDVVFRPSVGSVLRVTQAQVPLLGDLVFVRSGPYYCSIQKIPVYMAFFPYAHKEVKLPSSISGPCRAFTYVHVAAGSDYEAAATVC